MSLPASLLATLPGSAYTDPATFSAECATIFEHSWFCAAHASDLPEPGAFRTVQIGRENIIVTRDRNGVAQAFLNVCRHRGARICLEEQGSVKRTFRCPYHAWSYGLDGKLVAAPNLATMPDIDRTEYGLHRVNVREWLGYVWVSLADEPPSFEEDVVGAATRRLGDPEAISRYQVDSLTIGRRITYDVAANWKLIVENFMECYHCATIHPELVDVLPEFSRGFAAQYYVGHGAEFGPAIEGFTVDGGPGVERIPTVAAEQDRRYFAITVKPQVFINLVPDQVIVIRMIPLAVNSTKVECDWLFLPSVIAEGGDIDRSVELFHRVNSQDFEACERTQLGMSSRAYADGGVLVPSEHHLAEFHEWVTGRVATNS